jgi:hypothetical protein
VKRFASVTFDAVVAESERDVAVHSLASAGALVTSWTQAGDRTYALVVRHAAGHLRASMPGARIDEPSLAVVRISPRDVAAVGSLERAFAGPGRPRGVVHTAREGDTLVVALAPRVTSLSLCVALVDAVLASAPGRTIEPLLPLDDTTLAEFAGACLGEPHLDASRLIETHLEPLLASGSP